MALHHFELLLCITLNCFFAKTLLQFISPRITFDRFILHRFSRLWLASHHFVSHRFALHRMRRLASLCIVFPLHGRNLPCLALPRPVLHYFKSFCIAEHRIPLLALLHFELL
jgi:hypothetical protein